MFCCWVSVSSPQPMVLVLERLEMKGASKGLRITCGDCQFLGVTYQLNQPWKCSRFGFKSKDLPARVVLRETGMECAYYTSKAPLVRKIT